MEYPLTIEELIKALTLFPGIGRKTAERLAFYVFSEMDNNDVETLRKALSDTKELKHCIICGNISDNEDKCHICSDTARNHKSIMVVENIKDVFMLEKTETYDGLYHILNGAINFSNGIGIEDLNIKGLIDRIKTDAPEEVILATNATVEGETTARFIKTLLEEFDITISRIAFGLPVGGDIQYADEMTLLKALEGRRKY